MKHTHKNTCLPLLFLAIITLSCSNQLSVEKEIQHQLQLTNHAGGISIGEGNYTHNSQVLVIANPLDSFVFVGWYQDSTLISKEAAYKFKLDKDVHLDARFDYAINHTQDSVYEFILNGSSSFYLSEIAP